MYLLVSVLPLNFSLRVISLLLQLLAFYYLRVTFDHPSRITNHSNLHFAKLVLIGNHLSFFCERIWSVIRLVQQMGERLYFLKAGITIIFVFWNEFIYVLVLIKRIRLIEDFILFIVWAYILYKNIGFLFFRLLVHFVLKRTNI